MLTSDILEFRRDALQPAPTPIVDLHIDVGGAEQITIPDAHLLFQGEYHRVGFDLVLSDETTRVTIHDYFRAGKRPALASPDGARLSDDIVSALATSDAGERYAQAAPALAPQQIGRVETMTGSASAVRNGVSVELHAGDMVLKGDAVQTGSNSSLGISFIDGTVFSLSSGARMVLNDMVYQAGGQQNSAVISLVQGSISFLAGQVAKTGDMKVGTPVATMGIRGTLVHTENPAHSTDPASNTVTALNGVVSFSVVTERSGQTGAFDLFGQNGELIGRVSDPDIQWLIGSGSVLQEPKSAADRQAEFVIAQQVYQIAALAEANPLPPGLGNTTGPQGGGGPGSTTSPDINGTPDGRGNGSPINAQGIPVPSPEIPFDLPRGSDAPGTTPPGPIFTPPAPPRSDDGGTTQPSPPTPPPATPPPLASQTVPTVPDRALAVVNARNGLLASGGADAATVASERVVFVERGAQDDANHTAVDAGASGTTVAGEYGTLVVHADGTYSYASLRATALAEGEHGFDRFTYTAQNEAGLTSTATLTFDIAGVNDAPTPVDDTAIASPTTPIGATTRATGLLGNDTDPDHNETAGLQIIAVSTPGTEGPKGTQQVSATAPGVIHGQYGTLYLASDGTYSYVADSGTYLAPGAIASDRFTYTVSDGHAADDKGNADATFTVRLTGPGPVLDLDSTTAGRNYTANATNGDHILGTHVSITNDPVVRAAAVSLNSAPNDSETFFIGQPGSGADYTLSNSDTFLTFADGGHITASNASGYLLLTGDDAASVADFQEALDNVGLRNGGTLTPGMRSLAVQVSDGVYSSQFAFANVTIDQAPVVTTTHAASGTFYAIGGNPVTVDSGLGITDDGPQLTGATIKVALADGGVDTFDLLGFSNGPQSGYVFSSGTFNFDDSATVTTSYDASTGTLTLTGLASVNDYRLALDAVKFSTADTTTTEGRTVTFQVNDGTLPSNQPVDRIVVADTPHLGGDLTIEVDQGGTVTLTRGDLASTEAGKTDGQLTYTVSFSRGGFRLGSDSVTSFTQQDVDDGRVSYHQNGSETVNDVFPIFLTDDANDQTSGTFTVTVNAGNGAPTVTSNDQPPDVTLGPNLLANGGFETYNLSTLGEGGGSEAGFAAAIVAPAATDVPGWTTGGNFTTISANSTNHSGAASLQYGPTGTDGSLTQTVSTVAGVTYHLDFWLSNDTAPNSESGDVSNDFSVSWNGTTYLALTNQPAQDYTHYAFDVLGQDGSSFLDFEARNEPGYWHLDDVTVTAIATADGTITFTDPQPADQHTATFTPDAAGYVGTFTLDAVSETGGSGSFGWHFAVAGNDLAALGAGEFVDESYTITISDGHSGGDTTTSVALHLVGANDAPDLAAAELNTPKAGDTVANIFAGRFHDVDSGGDVDTGGLFAGIAVVADPTSSTGHWEYRASGSEGFVALGDASEGAAIVLSADTVLRFVAANGDGGTRPELSVVGIDDTYAGAFSGGDGPVTTDASVRGGATSFSAVPVALVAGPDEAGGGGDNTAPSVATTHDPSSDQLAAVYVIGDGATTFDTGVALSDDGATLASAIVQITLADESGTFDTSDVLSFGSDNSGFYVTSDTFDLKFYGDGGTIHQNYDATTGVLTLSGEASLADYQMALDAVAFSTTDTVTTSRTVTFQVNDGSLDSNVGSDTIRIAPYLDLNGPDSGTSYANGSAPDGTHILGQGVSIADSAGNAIRTATVTLTTFSDGDTLTLFDGEGFSDVVSSYDPETHTLTLTGNESATLSEFQAALDNVALTSNFEAVPDGERTLSVQVQEANGGPSSNVATADVTVSAPPPPPPPLMQGGGFGFSLASLGDQNGDGLSDLAIGAPLSGPGSVGISYSGGGGNASFSGAADGDQAGYSVADAGNFGGSGDTPTVQDDILVGAPGAFGGKGAAYIYDGGAISGTVTLGSAASGGHGLVISGEFLVDASAGVGTSVSGAGDVDRDGVADVIVGAPGGAGGNGAVYVVYGQGSAYSDVDLATVDAAPSTAGYAIHGAASGDQFGFSVAGGADINGDGYADVIIGAPHATGDAADAGAAYIVYGQSDSGTFTSVSASNSITNLASVTIHGVAGDHAGYAVANAGDVNGDGFDDLVIGAPDANGGAGAAYVVFGGSTLGGASHTIDLADIAAGTGGFVINGVTANDHLGFAVAGIQDVNDDGLADIIVGAPGRANTDGAAGSGGAYVIYGKTGTAPVDAGSLQPGSTGFDITGNDVDAGGNRGFSVASQGERDGNGYDDFAFGNPHSYDASSNTANSGGYGASGLDNPTMSVTFDGTSGNDDGTTTAALLGTAGRDIVDGRQGDDRIAGQGGGDYLIGGSGSDTFVFSALDSATINATAGTQHDTIKDFHTHSLNTGGNVADVIEIDGYANIQNFAALASHMSAANSHDTLITLDPAHSILLKNVIASTLGADDFHFNGTVSL